MKTRPSRTRTRTQTSPSPPFSTCPEHAPTHGCAVALLLCRGSRCRLRRTAQRGAPPPLPPPPPRGSPQGMPRVLALHSRNFYYYMTSATGQPRHPRGARLRDGTAKRARRGCAAALLFFGSLYVAVVSLRVPCMVVCSHAHRGTRPPDFLRRLLGVVDVSWRCPWQSVPPDRRPGAGQAGEPVTDLGLGVPVSRPAPIVLFAPRVLSSCVCACVC